MAVLWMMNNVMFKRLIQKTCIFACLLLISIPTFAAEFSYAGYLKSYALLQDGIEIKNSPQQFNESFQSQNSLRFMGNGFTEESGNFEVHYEVQPVYYSESKQADNSGGIGSTLSTGSTQYRYKDIDATLGNESEGDHIRVWQNLDRLNYQYSNQYGDITIGRQVVSFGSARFINPTDTFIPFTIQTLNQEYRVGIDALRYQADLGDFTVLDTGLIIGEDGEKENSATFIRGKSSINGNDLEAMYTKFNESWLLGGGIERALGGFGFWLESAYMHTSSNIDSYWRHSIGSDYALNENIILMLEYHYNGAGSNNPEDYLLLLSQEPYQKAGIFLLGKHYLIPAVSWIATPLINITASSFFNMSDQSVFVNLSSEINWSDNLYSDVGAYISYGDNLEYRPTAQTLNLGSEFGAYPLSLYASFRYYF